MLFLAFTHLLKAFINTATGSIRQEYPDNQIFLFTKPTFADAEKPQLSPSRRKKAKAIEHESEISTGSARVC
jgi:hypothetical protein